MTDIDLSCEVADLCEALGLDRTAVVRIVIEPTKAFVLLYRRNDQGKFYVDDTAATATETRTFDLSAT